MSFDTLPSKDNIYPFCAQTMAQCIQAYYDAAKEMKEAFDNINAFLPEPHLQQLKDVNQFVVRATTSQKFV